MVEKIVWHEKKQKRSEKIVAQIKYYTYFCAKIEKRDERKFFT